MKKILIFNALILSGLSLSAQNWINNSDDNVYASNVQVNTNLTNISVQQANNGNRGGSATNRLNVKGNNEVQVQTQTQTQVYNKPQQKKTVKVNTNINDININDNVGNVFENNMGNQSNPNINRGGNEVNDINLNSNIASNPQVNTNKTNNKTVVVTEEFNGTDFKPIGLSGRDYSNGGKYKKGVKNIPKMTSSKVKHKKKPGFKKVKYHTSKCAKW